MYLYPFQYGFLPLSYSRKLHAHKFIRKMALYVHLWHVSIRHTYINNFLYIHCPELPGQTELRHGSKADESAS